MISVVRIDLPEAVSSSMADLSRRIAAVPDADRDRYAQATKLWASGSVRKAVHGPVKEALCVMAPGLERCMYCGDNQGTDVDHFEPVRHNPLRTFDWLNHLLACSVCNSQGKRDLFPVDADGSPLLIDPTTEDPADHLFLSLSVGEYAPLSEKGRLTIEVCGLNRAALARGRMNARWVMTALFREWRSAHETGDAVSGMRAATTLREQPFADVCQAMLRQAIAPGAPIIFERTPDLVELLRFPPLRAALLH